MQRGVSNFVKYVMKINSAKNVCLILYLILIVNVNANNNFLLIFKDNVLLNAQLIIFLMVLHVYNTINYKIYYMIIQHLHL